MGKQAGMKTRSKGREIGLLLLVAALGAGAAYAQVGGYDLGWWTVDGGAGDSSGGAYALSGAAAQPDAGTLAGGTYHLEGGFWPGAAGPSRWAVYLPLVRR